MLHRSEGCCSISSEKQMTQKRETNLIQSDRVIHTRYFGDVQREFILEAIDEWHDILTENKNVRFLIFDYTEANMDALSPEDAQAIADKTPLLLRPCPSLRMIGVMPRDSDFTITSVWSAYSTTADTDVTYDNISIARSLAEAKEMIQLYS